MWWGYLNVFFLIQSSSSLLLRMLQYSISHTSFWFSCKLSCWIWLFQHESKKLWINYVVVSSVNHSWSLEIRSQLVFMHVISPLFEVGKHLWVIHVNTTYLGNRYPFATKDATKTSWFLFSTLNTYMCFVLLLSQVLSSIVGTRFIRVQFHS